MHFSAFCVLVFLSTTGVGSIFSRAGSSGDSRIKKVGEPLRGVGKSRGGQQSYLLYMYRTYVNQMNWNGKLRKKLGGPSKNLGGPCPPLGPP